MSEAGGPMGERGRKIHGGFINSPIGIIGSAAARRHIEQAGIEPDRVRQAFDHHVQMKPLHAITFLRLDIPAGLCTTAPWDRDGAPLQQFSVR